jgi:tRNA A-37 threonylcarbamoyl transferase component Bud32
MYFLNEKSNTFRFVTVLNFGVQGVLIESDIAIDKESKLKIMIKNSELNPWNIFFCRVAWVQGSEDKKIYKIGLEFLFPIEDSLDSDPGVQDEISSQDLDCILYTRLLKTIPKKGICSFLNCMSRKTIGSGIRFITKGDKADCLYIIQQGVCGIQLQESEDTHKAVAQRRAGDVIGEMALLTGELRTADVTSESQMILWKLSKSEFDTACQSHPDIREFLTELLTNRLENSTVTEVRNVGRYRMTHQIGQGGGSFVYKGEHKSLNLPVAIKMMKHHPAMDEDFRENFKKESKFIAQLNHPNIVRIYDIEELYRTIFIIMECLEGESLKALLERKGALPFSRALTFLTQVCSGLAYAHDHHITHREVKPANIFILKNDHIKLLDFGLAFSPREEDFEQTGSAPYMSPEQIKGDPVDFRSDIYSLGIATYEMFTGKKPFAGDEVTAWMRMNTSMDIPDPSILVPDIPEPIKRFIIKSCAHSPDKRYNSMQEIIDELSNITKLLKEDIEKKSDINREMTVLLISHDKTQNLAMNKLLDEFSRRADKIGISLNIAGKN